MVNPRDNGRRKSQRLILVVARSQLPRCFFQIDAVELDQTPRDRTSECFGRRLRRLRRSTRHRRNRDQRSCSITSATTSRRRADEQTQPLGFAAREARYADPKPAASSAAPPAYQVPCSRFRYTWPAPEPSTLQLGTIRRAAQLIRSGCVESNGPTPYGRRSSCRRAGASTVKNPVASR